MSRLDALLARGTGPRSLHQLQWPAALRVLVLAPHPDDFDAIAVTLRRLHLQGHAIDLAVLTTGAGGVDEGFEGAVDEQARAALREREQRDSCALFGLPPGRIAFLRLWSGHAGGAAPDALAPLREWLRARPADLLFLPHGNDSNATHRRSFEAARSLAAELGLQAWALLNRDAKTQGMRIDLHLGFGAAEAQWKAQLLRLHRSQQARNLRTRGRGFDQRVLAVNAEAAAELGLAQPYAEVFELMRLGAPE